MLSVNTDRLRRPLCNAALALILLCAAPVFASDLDAAQQDWAAGNLNSALVRLKSALQSNPNDAAARLLLGQIYLANGEAAAAEQELERARAHGAADAEVLPPLVESLLAQRKQSQVMELTEVSADAPATLRADLLSLRGTALLGADDPEAARRAFEQACEADPRAIRPLLGLASLALAEGDADATRELVRKTIEIAPDQAEGWSALGALEYQTQNFEAAADAYSRALENARGKWLLHYQRGLALLETQRPARASADLKALQDAAPKFPGSYYLSGRLRLLEDKPEEALNDLERYLQQAPEDPRAIYFAALALSKLDRTAQADEYLTRLLARYPNTINATLLLGRIRLDSGNAAAAEAVLAPVVARTDAPLMALELMRRALAQQGRQQQAADLIEQAATRHPESVPAQLAYARLLQRQGKPNDSARIARAVIEQEPDNAQARMLLIRAELLAGNADAASAEADAYLIQAPDSATAVAAKAALLTQQGETEAARAEFKRALEIEPGSERAALALAALELADERVDAARKVIDDLLVQAPGSTNAVLARAAIERQTSGDAAFVAQIRSGLDAAPDNLQLRTILVQQLLAQDDHAQALRLLDQTPATQTDEPALMTLRAQAELSAGHPELASATLARLAARNPRSARVRFMQATASAASGDSRAMQLHLSEGLVLDQQRGMGPDRLAALVGRLAAASEREQLMAALRRAAPEHPAVIDVNARYAVQRREFDQAIDDLSRLHQDYPGQLVYMLDLAEALSAAGRKRQAMAVVTDWISDHPQATRPRLLLAQMQLEAGDTAAAIEQYRQVVASDRENAVALNNLAMLIASDQPREARDFAERALQLRPNDPSFIDTMGTVLFSLGELQQARDLLARAHAGTPDPSIALRYAKALAATGDKDGARRVLLETQTRAFPEKAEADALFLELAQDR